MSRHAEHPKRPKPLGYAAALNWMVQNDDTEWLDDWHPVASATAELLAAIFDRPIEKVIADLRKMKETE